MSSITPTKAPSIPVPSGTVDAAYFTMISNALRLYFGQVDNATGQLTDAANTTSVQQWLDGGCY